MSEEWFVNNDIPVLTTSRIIAKVFNKKHGYVLKKIDDAKKLAALMDRNNMFIESEYKTGNNNTYREYLVDRDGFAFIAMSFTGPEAAEWRFKYIEAFNDMEDAIRNQVLIQKDHRDWFNETLENLHTDDGRQLRFFNEDQIERISN